MFITRFNYLLTFVFKCSNEITVQSDTFQHIGLFHTLLKFSIYIQNLSSGSELGGSLLDLLDVTRHIERRLGQTVELAGQDLLETLDGILELHETTTTASEHLSDVERLGHETLGLAGTGHGQLVVLGQLIHTKNGNDILETLVVLEELLGGTGSLVVNLTDHTGVKHSTCGVEGIHGRVDTELGNLTGKHGGGIQVRESGGRGGIGKIIGRHVHSLHRGNGTNTGGGNALLEQTHVRGEGGLVTHGGRDTAEQGRHLGTGLGETENVVDEQKHVLALLVTEVLGNGQTGQGHTGTGSGGLVHLTVHQGSLGAGDGLAGGLVHLDHTTLNHLVVQIVTLTGALTDTGEHGVTTVVHGDVVNQLHDHDSLADSGTTEKSNLTSLGIRSQQVDDLDAGHQNLLGLALLGEERGRAMDRSSDVALDRALLVDGLTDDVQDTAEGAGADGNHDRSAGVLHLLASDETLGGLHTDGADGVLTQVLGNLEDEAGRAGGNGHLKGVQDRGKVTIELSKKAKENVYIVIRKEPGSKRWSQLIQRTIRKGGGVLKQDATVCPFTSKDANKCKDFRMEPEIYTRTVKDWNIPARRRRHR